MWKTIRVLVKRKYRVMKRKPRFLMKYLMVRMLFRVACMCVYMIGSMITTILPFFTMPDLASYRMSDFLRHIKNIPLGLGELRFALQDMILRVTGNLSVDSVSRLIRVIPLELRNLLSQLGDALHAGWQSFKAFVRGLWPPGQAGRRFLAFLKRNLSKLRRFSRAIVSFLLMLLLLKLTLVFILPLLSIGVITFVGLDVTFLLVVLLQMIFSGISRFLSRKLNHHAVQGYRFYRGHTTRYIRCKVRKYTYALMLAWLRRLCRWMLEQNEMYERMNVMREVERRKRAELRKQRILKERT